MEQNLFGSSEAAAMGGKARAKALSVENRKAIAQKAADARWGNKACRAIVEAPLVLKGENGFRVEFECAVLDDAELDKDKTRVISERAFSRAIGAKRGGSHWQRKKLNPDGANLPVFLSANNLSPFITMDLAAALSEPIVYITNTGQRANGIKAELIPKILEVWVKADDAGKLTKPQKPFGVLARAILGGLGKVAIVALIDEATGFEDIRTKNTLAEILEDWVAKELRQWVGTFPLSFFKALCRLKNIPFRSDMKLPRYFGHYVNDLVWSRLAPGLLDELKRKNPTLENGRRKNNHTQWITKIGDPKLLYHIGRLEGIAEDFQPGEYDQFRAKVEQRLPKPVAMPLFDDLPTKGTKQLP
jgi:hypothetical protein